MRITRDEAAAALSEIDATTSRLGARRGYHVAGPILMLWGLVWLCCYSAMGFLAPEQWGWPWLFGNTVGVTGTILLASRAGTGSSGSQWSSWRPFVAGLAIAAFVGATLSVFGVEDTNAYLTFPGLVCGAIYFTIGLMHRTRYLVIGAAVFAASLVGFFGFPDILPFWMAGVGAVGLFLGGLWMRSA